MSDDNTAILRPRTVPPYVVIDTLKERVKDIDHIYVVAFEGGQPVIYASGDLNLLCMAAMSLQDLAFKFLNGQVQSER